MWWCAVHLHAREISTMNPIVRVILAVKMLQHCVLSLVHCAAHGAKMVTCPEVSAWCGLCLPFCVSFVAMFLLLCVLAVIWKMLRFSLFLALLWKFPIKNPSAACTQPLCVPWNCTNRPGAVMWRRGRKLPSLTSCDPGGWDGMPHVSETACVLAN